MVTGWFLGRQRYKLCCIVLYSIHCTIFINIHSNCIKVTGCFIISTVLYIVQGVPEYTVSCIVQGVPEYTESCIVQGVPEYTVPCIVQGVPQFTVSCIVRVFQNTLYHVLYRVFQNWLYHVLYRVFQLLLIYKLLLIYYYYALFLLDFSWPPVFKIFRNDINNFDKFKLLFFLILWVSYFATMHLRSYEYKSTLHNVHMITIDRNVIFIIHE